MKSDDAAAGARAGLGLGARVTKKQLRWYMGAPVRLEPLLFEPNPHHWLNTSLSLAAPAITGGGWSRGRRRRSTPSLSVAASLAAIP